LTRPHTTRCGGGPFFMSIRVRGGKRRVTALQISF
jgi:hypothetical protein